MLRDAVLAAAGPAQMGLPVGAGIADSIAVAAQHAVPGDIDDDMAILVLRSSPTDLASRERCFPAQPIMVSEARRWRRRRSLPGRWTPTRPTSPACWSPRS